MTENGKIPDRLTPERAEDAYDLLTGYRFAKQYVEGKTVADINWSEFGYGAGILAEDAEHVESLTGDPERLEQARSYYPRPNVHYGILDFLEFPYQTGHFDVVVAFRVLEHLEWRRDFIAEARRVLKEDGLLIVSAADRRVTGGKRSRALHSAELAKSLEQSFEHVRMYRQGAISGGIVVPEGEDVSDSRVESARFALTNPAFGSDSPETGSLLAVCGGPKSSLGDSSAGSEARGNGKPYLLLDRDHRLLDENEDRREDIRMLRNEIRHMQETEVQSFRNALDYYTGGFAMIFSQSRLLYRLENTLPGQLARLALKVAYHAYVGARSAATKKDSGEG
jgi:SAM-dependent methyltransferase